MASQQVTVEDFADLVADQVSSKLGVELDKSSSLLLSEVKKIRSLFEVIARKESRTDSTTEKPPEKVEKAFGNILPKNVSSAISNLVNPKPLLESAKTKATETVSTIKEKASDSAEKIQKTFLNLLPKNFVANIINKEQNLNANINKPDSGSSPKSLLEASKTIQQVEIKNFKDLSVALAPLFKDAFSDFNKNAKEISKSIKDMSKDIKEMLKKFDNLKGGDSSDLTDLLPDLKKNKTFGKIKQWAKKTKVGKLARRANIALQRTLPRAARRTLSAVGEKAGNVLARVRGSSVGRAVERAGEGVKTGATNLARRANIALRRTLPRSARTVLSTVGEKAGSVLGKIKGSSVGKAIGTVGEKAGSVLGKLGPVAKVGGAALGILAAKSEFDKRKEEGQSTTQAVVGTAGGVGGGLAGAAIGQALIPIPIVGAVIGGAIGSWLGGKAGDKISGASKEKEETEKGITLDKAVKEYPQLEKIVKQLEATPKEDFQSAEKLKMLKKLNPRQISFLVAGQKTFHSQPALQSQMINTRLNHLYSTEYVKMIGADHLEGGLPVDKEGKPLNKEHEQQVKGAQGAAALTGNEPKQDTKAPAIAPEPVKEALKPEAKSIEPATESKAPAIAPKPIKKAVDKPKVEKAGTSMLKGATAGALAGAAVGSAIPVVGTVIGAAVGGVIGGVGSKLFGSKPTKTKPQRRISEEEKEEIEERNNQRGYQNEIAALLGKTKGEPVRYVANIPVDKEDNPLLPDEVIQQLQSKHHLRVSEEPKKEINAAVQMRKEMNDVGGFKREMGRMEPSVTQTKAPSITPEPVKEALKTEAKAPAVTSEPVKETGKIPAITPKPVKEAPKTEAKVPASSVPETSKVQNVIPAYQPSVKPTSVAASVTSSAPSPSLAVNISNKPATASKDDNSLEEIASNTKNTNEALASLVNGFNNMAKALRELGVNISNQPPVVINKSSGVKAPKSSSPVTANAGNPEISNFRMGVVEVARFQPI